jgi:hypothetical protein
MHRCESFACYSTVFLLIFLSDLLNTFCIGCGFIARFSVIFSVYGSLSGSFLRNRNFRLS